MIQNAVIESSLVSIADLKKEFAIFRPRWARAFAPYCGGARKGGKVFDRILAESAFAWKPDRRRRNQAAAFNARFVTRLLDNMRAMKFAYVKERSKWAS